MAFGGIPRDQLPPNTGPCTAGYEEIEELQSGGTSTVRLCKCNTTGKFYAVKEMFKQAVKENDWFRYLAREREALSKLDHPFIIKLHSYWEDPYCYYFCLDYMRNGDMYDNFSKFGGMHIDVVRFYTAEIVVALEYLRYMGYVHRDLKMENLLLDENNHIRLTDFGTCKKVGQPQGKTPDEITASMYNSHAGTRHVMAPEVINKEEVCFSTDLWNLGCTTFEMATGEYVFNPKPDSTLFKRIKNLMYSFPKSPQVDPQCKDLVEKLLAKDPEDRLGAEGYDEVKAHPFYAGIQWQNLHMQPAPHIRAAIEPEADDTPSDWNNTASPPPGATGRN